jgi:hypothetical protein
MEATVHEVTSNEEVDNIMEEIWDNMCAGDIEKHTFVLNGKSRTYNLIATEEIDGYLRKYARICK